MWFFKLIKANKIEAVKLKNDDTKENDKHGKILDMIERHNFILTGNNDDICFSYCVFAYSIYVGVNESNEIMWRIKCCLSYSFILIMILSICIANDGIIRISARTIEIQKLHLSCLSSLKAMILHSKWYIYVYLFRYSDSLTRTHMKINKKNTLTDTNIPLRGIHSTFYISFDLVAHTTTF